MLKEIWAEEIELPENIGKEPITYLKKLKENISQALKFADEHAQVKQKQYADHYNKTAVDKEFDPGELVVVLYPTSSNKLLSKWHGPCQVLQRRSKHSYLVDLNDQGHKIIHANKMKKYYVRALNCVAVIDDDINVGEVVEQPCNLEKVESLCINENQLCHLSQDQRKDLMMLLNEFDDRFSVKPGLCKL